MEPIFLDSSMSKMNFSEMDKEPRPLSVGELTRQLQVLAREYFSQVTVVGEIFDITHHKSGHCYLTLKDSESDARLSAVIWNSTLRQRRNSGKFDLKVGLEVVCRGRIDIYAPRGNYQLIITKIDPVGQGSLDLAFRQLHEKLQNEGLFAQERKRPVSSRPRRIAVVTSASGAAIRDFVTILRDRSRRVDVLIYPVQVQGESASREIEAAFNALNRHFTPRNSDFDVKGADEARKLDAIVLIRGGGSPEDLWAFNEERTVRAVASSVIPVVTGIGHEVDVSLSDLAADLHAKTPSDAAARLIPNDADLPHLLEDYQSRLFRGISLHFEFAKERLGHLEKNSLWEDPADRIFGTRRMTLDHLTTRLDHSIENALVNGDHRLKELAGRLESLSPLGILSRGYSLTRKESGEVIRLASDVHQGEIIVTRLHQGILKSHVTEIVSGTEGDDSIRKEVKNGGGE